MREEQAIAYAAGFFDGEGHIAITRVKKARSEEAKYHVMSVSISNTNLTVLKWFEEHFSGRVSSHRMPLNPNWLPSWRWTAANKGAEAFLKTVLPYLIVKREQALVALEFRKIRVPTTAVIGGKRGQKVHSVEEFIGAREACRAKLLALRADGREVVLQ